MESACSVSATLAKPADPRGCQNLSSAAVSRKRKWPGLDKDTEELLLPQTATKSMLLGCGHICTTCMQLRQRDHAYSTPVPCEKEIINVVEELPIRKDVSSVSLVSVNENDACEDLNDSVYAPETDEDISSSSELDLTSELSSKLVNENKFIVFDSCLNGLFGLLRCPVPGCCMPFDIDDIKRDTHCGMQLTCTFVCLHGHTTKWSSQPFVGNMPAGNILSTAATLLCGQTYTHISQFANFLGLSFTSDTTFYNIQKQFVVPSILKAWASMQGQILHELKSKNSPLRLAGDGRCDSPGFNAKYCTYTLMDMYTDAVVAFVVVEVTTTGSSSKMELEGFRVCVEYLLDQGFQIDVLATDRHVQIRSEIKKQKTNINHQFDVWHLAKSVKKKLLQKAKLKGNEELMPWLKSITNHLWWSAANCDENPDKLEEMWKSVLHHIVGEHEFEGEFFKKCSHEPLSPEQDKKKRWLKRNSSCHDSLKSVVLDKRLVNDIRSLSQFCHTGALEVYHSLMTKYVPKRQAFDTNVMEARTCLAALDHNHSLGRQQKVDRKTGEKCFKLVFPKATSQWVVKPRMEEKTYTWVNSIIESVVDLCKEHQFAQKGVESGPQKKKGNIATVPAPSKAEAIARHYTRFSGKKTQNL